MTNSGIIPHDEHAPRQVKALDGRDALPEEMKLFEATRHLYSGSGVWDPSHTSEVAGTQFSHIQLREVLLIGSSATQHKLVLYGGVDCGRKEGKEEC